MAAARTARMDGGTRGRSDRAAPRTGAKQTVMEYAKQLPQFLALLWGLIRDPRVAMMDKVLVAGAIAYIVTPMDFIPDFIPFLGEVDDVYLLVLALRRLLENAGRKVLLSHWAGAPETLRTLNLRLVIAAAAFFLPRRIRRRLQVIGRV
jgi:uncharacterized membrane protein YkvA (DUF1232 family)